MSGGGAKVGVGVGLGGLDMSVALWLEETEGGGLSTEVSL